MIARGFHWIERNVLWNMSFSEEIPCWLAMSLNQFWPPVLGAEFKIFKQAGQVKFSVFLMMARLFAVPDKFGWRNLRKITDIILATVQSSVWLYASISYYLWQHIFLVAKISVSRQNNLGERKPSLCSLLFNFFFLFPLFSRFFVM